MAILLRITYDSERKHISEVWFDEGAVSTAAGCLEDTLRQDDVEMVEIIPGSEIPELR